MFSLSARSVDAVCPVSQVVVKVWSVVEAFAKAFNPVKVLLFARSVVEAPVKVVTAFHASALVVENARPREEKYDAEVVEKKLVVPCQYAALVVEK